MTFMDVLGNALLKLAAIILTGAIVIAMLRLTGSF